VWSPKNTALLKSSKTITHYSGHAAFRSLDRLTHRTSTVYTSTSPHIPRPLPLGTTILLSASVYLTLIDSTCKRGYVGFVFFLLFFLVVYLYLISLSMLSSRSILVVANGMIFFLKVEWYTIVYLNHSFFVHLSIRIFVGCFHVLTVVNDLQWLRSVDHFEGPISLPQEFAFLKNSKVMLMLLFWGQYCFQKILFSFIWRIISLQCCVGFSHTSAWTSHGCTYVSSLLNLLPSSHPILPLQVVTEQQVEPLVLYSSFPLAIYSTHADVYISMLLSQFRTSLGDAAPDRMLWTAVQEEALMGCGKEGKVVLCHQRV